MNEQLLPGLCERCRVEISKYRLCTPCFVLQYHKYVHKDDPSLVTAWELKNQGRLKEITVGMDLVPNNPLCESWHANWSGWGQLRDLLKMLGCDTSAMSGMNDGDHVASRIALAWVDAINEALNYIVDIMIPSTQYMGDLVSILAYLPEKDYCCWSDSDVQDFLDNYVNDEYHRFRYANFGDDNPFVPYKADDASVRPLDEETIKWLTDFTRFCTESKGFRQY